MCVLSMHISFKSCTLFLLYPPTCILNIYSISVVLCEEHLKPGARPGSISTLGIHGVLGTVSTGGQIYRAVS